MPKTQEVAGAQASAQQAPQPSLKYVPKSIRPWLATLAYLFAIVAPYALLLRSAGTDDQALPAASQPLRRLPTAPVPSSPSEPVATVPSPTARATSTSSEATVTVPAPATPSAKFVFQDFGPVSGGVVGVKVNNVGD